MKLHHFESFQRCIILKEDDIIKNQKKKKYMNYKPKKTTGQCKRNSIPYDS